MRLHAAGPPDGRIRLRRQFGACGDRCQANGFGTPGFFAAGSLIGRSTLLWRVVRRSAGGRGFRAATRTVRLRGILGVAQLIVALDFGSQLFLVKRATPCAAGFSRPRGSFSARRHR